MINVSINGEDHYVEDNTTVAALLEALKISIVGVAVERNREIVPKSTHKDAVLKDGDVLEIVRMTGGG